MKFSISTAKAILKRKFIFISLLFALILVCVQMFRRKRISFNCPPSMEPIDAVYTWVNGTDSKFLRELQRFTNNPTTIERDISKQRFNDKYELKFSLRSLEQYAPWFRHVFIVTNGQIPYWLDLDYEKITVISHSEIFPDSFDLPSFSSPAIESHLHRIPGLSRRFVYFNDDCFLGARTYREDFLMVDDGGYVVYMAWPLPMCALDCSWLYVADGECDLQCNNADCQMDGGDCDENESVITTTTTTTESGKNFELLRDLVKKNHHQTYYNLTDLIAQHNNRVMFFNKYKNHRRKKPIDTNLNVLLKKLIMNKNFDAYGASLQHTNRVFNRHYGFTMRQVPAHAPILIDRVIMQDLQAKFRKEFQITSRNRFRRADDMQFSFSYYHYLMHEQSEKSISEIFDQFDTDKSNTWSDREIRTLLTQLYQLPLSYQIVEHFESLLTNCSTSVDHPQISTPEFERYIDSRLPTITKTTIINCVSMQHLLKKHFGYTAKYKTHIIKNSENTHVTFKMLNSNVSDVVMHLDEIRRNPKKFICLNDNLDDRKLSENELVKAILYDFYLSLFPKPSKFELRPDLRNRFLYLDELEQWRAEHFKIKLCIYFFVVLLCYITFFHVFKVRYVCRLLNKIAK